MAILGTAHPGSAPSAPNDAALASHAIVPPGHPPANVANQVPFNCDLYAIDNTPDCIYSSLLNIDYARSLEGVGPMVLPSDYAGLRAVPAALRDLQPGTHEPGTSRR